MSQSGEQISITLDGAVKSVPSSSKITQVFESFFPDRVKPGPI
jgi:hypothetical protein